MSDGLIGGIAVHRRDPVVRDCLEYAHHQVNQHQANSGTYGKRNVPFKIRRSPPAPSEAKEDVACRHHDDRFELGDHIMQRDDDVRGKDDAGGEAGSDCCGWLGQQIRARDLGKEVRNDLKPLGHDVRWTLRQRNARRIRTELGEAVDDGRYPGLAIDENGVEERDDQQLLNQAEEQAVEVVFPEQLRRTPGEVQEWPERRTGRRLPA